MARYPAEHKRETRQRILAASDALMKDRGVEAASVDAVMRGAGLTVGGFYAHFASKEDLAAETLLYGLEQSFERMIRALAGRRGDPWVRAMIRAYLAQADDPDLAHACPMTLLLADVARDDDARKRRFADATRRMLDRVVEHFPARDGLTPRETALATYAALVGAVGLARTTPSPTARHAIMRACETMLVRWLGLDVGDATAARSGEARPRPAEHPRRSRRTR
ncbi:MAG TPA: TetR/AcrR family transcriptional regulator [Casimicrobiaceae bacterium]|nr:TetR/AcrR family transcriptional regulator [Casimicrobiaceae bacterium]